MNTEILKKFAIFFLGICFSLFLTLAITYFFQRQNNGVLFFSAFNIAIISGILSSTIYLAIYRDKFTYFTILLSYILFNALFIYLGPVSLDRSLSSFIYFYSVENGKIRQDIFDEKYFRPYIQRRFDDGVKIGYLKCDNEICYPTAKTKMTYKLLHPLSKFSGVIHNYNDFKNHFNNCN